MRNIHRQLGPVSHGETHCECHQHSCYPHSGTAHLRLPLHTHISVPLFSGYHFAKFLPCPRAAAYNCTFTFDRERDWRTPRFTSRNSLHRRKRSWTKRRRRILPSHFVAATRLQAKVSSDWCSNLRHRFLSLLEAVSKQTTLARRHRYLQYPDLHPVRASDSYSCFLCLLLMLSCPLDSGRTEGAPRLPVLLEVRKNQWVCVCWGFQLLLLLCLRWRKYPSG